jgi:hypothetical protein
MRATIAALIFLLCTAFSGAVRAADLFTVSGLPVEATAGSAAEARPQALAAGQRVALRTMLRRLTHSSDHARLPAPTDALVNETVQGIQIAEERTAPTRYIAKLNVTFRPAAIRSLLRSAGIGYSETPTGPLLVLAVLRDGERLALWDEPNPWRTAWNAMAPDDGLATFIPPVGDLGDAQAIDAQRAVDGDDAALRAIAGRYERSDVLIAEATPASNGAVDIVLRQIGRGGRVTVFSTRLGEPVDQPESFAAAVREAVARFEDDWKRETQIQLDRPAQLVATAPLGGLNDWILVRQRLSETPEVSSYEVDALTTKSATLTLNYFGEPRRLAAALAGRGLTLSSGDGAWVLRTQGERGGTRR